VARKLVSPLHVEVRDAANRGFAAFPVPETATLIGQAEQLIDEATSDISRLEELAAKHPSCGWRVALDPSQLCVLVVSGSQGRASLAELSLDEDDCLTLRAQRGETGWAFFRRPRGLRLLKAARNLTPGLAVLAEGESCPIPPSGGSVWLNSWAEIEAVPVWLRTLVFESPDDPPAQILPVEANSRLSSPCRSTRRIEKQHRRSQRGYSTCNHPGRRSGFQVSRRR
jgi:hypothetical protein